MADRKDDWRNTRSLEDAVRDLREPEMARELRNDGGDLNDVVEEAARRARAANDTLQQTAQHLQETAAHLDYRRRELKRTGDIVEEVRAAAEELDEQVERTHEQAEDAPSPEAGGRRSTD